MTLVPYTDIVEHFATELAGVVGALAEKAVTTVPAHAHPEGGFRITMLPDEGGRGELYAQIDLQGAVALARLALGAGDELQESNIGDGLRDMCGQAMTSVIERQQVDGVRVVVRSVETVTEPADASAVLKGLAVEGEPPISVALWGTLELGVAASQAGTTAPPARVPGSLASPPSRTNTVEGPDLASILDLELPLIVRFGRAELALKDLATLAPGAVIDLGRSPDDPVEVLVSNQVVARGEVVTVNGNYGVRITDVIGAADRIRHMEIGS
jgi:flagellar motor switch protein FliN/FliY